MHIYPHFMNVNSRAGVAYRAMKAQLRSATQHRGTSTQRGEFSCKPVDLEASAAKYEEIANGGSSPNKAMDKRHKRVVREDTDAEVQAKVGFWRSGASLYFPPTTFRTENDGELEERLGLSPLTSNVSAPQSRTIKYKNGETATIYYVYCSFCGTCLDATTATRERGSHRVACKDHVLNFREIRFPESAG